MIAKSLKNASVWRRDVCFAIRNGEGFGELTIDEAWSVLCENTSSVGDVPVPVRLRIFNGSGTLDCLVFGYFFYDC